MARKALSINTRSLGSSSTTMIVEWYDFMSSFRPGIPRCPRAGQRLVSRIWHRHRQLSGQIEYAVVACLVLIGEIPYMGCRPPGDGRGRASGMGGGVANGSVPESKPGWPRGTSERCLKHERSRAG